MNEPGEPPPNPPEDPEDPEDPSEPGPPAAAEETGGPGNPGDPDRPPAISDTGRRGSTGQTVQPGEGGQTFRPGEAGQTFRPDVGGQTAWPGNTPAAPSLVLERPRTAFSRPLVMGAVIMAFVVLMGGIAAGGYLMVDGTFDDDGRSDSSDAGRVSVFLCVLTSTTPKCGRRVASEQEKQAIKRRLQGMRGVRSVVYESQMRAWENFKKRFADNKEMIERVRPGDLPDSFRVQAEDADAARAVKAAIEGSPGVDAVVIGPIPARA